LSHVKNKVYLFKRPDDMSRYVNPEYVNYIHDHDHAIMSAITFH